MKVNQLLLRLFYNCSYPPKCHVYSNIFDNQRRVQINLSTLFLKTNQWFWIILCYFYFGWNSAPITLLLFSLCGIKRLHMLHLKFIEILILLRSLKFATMSQWSKMLIKYIKPFPTLRFSNKNNLKAIKDNHNKQKLASVPSNQLPTWKI